MTPYLVILLGLVSLFTITVVRRSNSLFILIFAITARLLLLFTTPTLSEDPYRYLWDGEQIAQGKNPYQTSPALEHDARPFYEKIKTQKRPSIYFPLAQIIFVIAFLIKPFSFLGLKLLIVISDLITILLLHGYRKEAFNIYLLSPLVLIESYLGLHLDSFLIPLTLGFIIFERRNPLASSIFLAISLMIRPTLAIITPIFLYRNRNWHNLLPLIIAGLFAIPYLNQGCDALTTYLRHWEFNGSIYYLIKLVIINHSLYARIIAYLTFIIIYPFLFKRRDAYPIVLGLFFLCSPAVYPWYLLPLFIISLLVENPFLILCYTSLLSYSVLIPYWKSGLWRESSYAIILEYLPVYLLMTKHFSILEKLLPSTFRK